MPGTILRKEQPSKAVDLSDPTVLEQAREQRDRLVEDMAREQHARRLQARAKHLRAKAARLPLNSNGREKALREAVAAEQRAHLKAAR